MLKEIIKTNLEKLKPWIQKEKIEAFRIYERESKEFPFVIDIYGNNAHIQIYENESKKDELWRSSIKDSLQDILNIDGKNCFFKYRKRQKEGAQYEKLSSTGQKLTITEYGIKYFINLKDYIDTGIFLDHRQTRKILPPYLKNVKRLLNLFAYTGAFNLVAAKSGVEFTTAVDMSNTYCNWARENFQLNKLDKFKHIAIRENVFFFLENLKQKKWSFDFIVIDPPTASRSKKMLHRLDIQRDYITLINSSLNFLNPGGKILFSTNFQKFKFDYSAINSEYIEDITKQTFPPDFKDKKIHKVYIISK